MTDDLDLKQLLIRESEQVEWKENVADIDDVVKTLSAFANDLANLGGGHVVCGAKEEKDANGFPQVIVTGLSASKIKEIEGTVMTRCRDHVSPGISPTVRELPGPSPDRRVLVFTQPATQQAHTFQPRNDRAAYFVRRSRATETAQNGILRELLALRGAMPPWDMRPCPDANVNDLDLLVLRDALQKIGIADTGTSIESFVSDTKRIAALVPPLLVKEPMTGILRPRNFAMLLFGRDLLRFIPGAFVYYSIYPGVDKTESTATRHELTGTLLEQARALEQLLSEQCTTIFQKKDISHPNLFRYPERALKEAMVNALAHRDYSLRDPLRITVFSDRIEFRSPGSLPRTIDPVEFREGRSGPQWRNQALTWFLTRTQLAQAEGQGIPTIRSVLSANGSPPPIFDLKDAEVTCTIAANSRDPIERELALVEQLLLQSKLERAAALVAPIVREHPKHSRAVKLFAEVSRARGEWHDVFRFVSKQKSEIHELAPSAIIALADAIRGHGDHPADMECRATDAETNDLLLFLITSASEATCEHLEECIEAAQQLLWAGENQHVIEFIERQLSLHPEWRRSRALAQIQLSNLVAVANNYSAAIFSAVRSVRSRAWTSLQECLRAIDDLIEAFRGEVVLSNDESTLLGDLRRIDRPD